VGVPKTNNEMTTKVSFVIAARNDDYGGNFANRMRTSIRTLAELTERYSGMFELVIVEYDPPNEKPPLSSLLLGIPHTHLPIRIVVVPRSFHERIAGSSKNPFLEYIAKNIGIRRSHGEFIVSTNPDIIFSAEIIKLLVTSKLDAHAVYRANRHDLWVRAIDESLTTDSILRICTKTTTRAWTPHGQIYLSWIQWARRLRRHLSPGSLWQTLTLIPLGNRLRLLQPVTKPHDAAAGDFVMAHRDAWATVRGYDQEPVNSYTDGYHIYMMHAYGYHQIVLQQPIYHISHTASNSITFQRSFQKYLEETQKMIATGTPHKLYSENWGFPKEPFSEYSV
jgi:hypothetical protein